LIVSAGKNILVQDGGKKWSKLDKEEFNNHFYCPSNALNRKKLRG